MRRRTVSWFLGGMAALLAIFTMPASVLAQGGSIGGTIGKQNKSVSGSDESRPQARKPKSDTAQEAKPSGCGNFFGVWTSGGGS